MLQDCMKLLFSSTITAEFVTWGCDDFKLTSGTLELQSDDGAVSGKSGIVVLLEFRMPKSHFLLQIA